VSGAPPPIIAVVGPTATGKSDLALALAEALEGEVINADAMQFYRGMDIGTAKLRPEERRGIPHHQIDTLEVVEDASVARFQAAARADADGIHARGRRAIAVGGSGLYLRALVDKFEFPETDPAVRAGLEARAEVEGPGLLHRELAVLDPAAARKIQPQNTKRIVRALEVIAITGLPFSSTLPTRTYALPAVQIGLRVPLDFLDARIGARAREMWDGGLLGETRELVTRGLREGVTARRAVGYAEALAHLDGAVMEEAAREATARNTRRLARKQLRWFGPDERVFWIEGRRAGEDPSRVLADALAALGTLGT
jgi:tRNA dimethylallyltransferase